ncbi:MAG: hypothetical protein PHF86_12360 [Candidatus Nanoarchaeia archaeon]|nr:hypothetical protein [Candidatus Nanoarchaeia archaeon]
MVKYLCQSCSYRFKPRGDTIPKNCPACGKLGTVIRDYDANAILEAVTSEE